VCDNVSMFATTQVEADGQSTGIRMGIIVRYQRDSSRVREAYGNGRRVGTEVRCTGEFLGLFGGSECTTK
jgi:hypothetical protein